MSTIHDKIRKLIALGENNPNEHEAEQALALATRLMLQHGIDRDSLSEAQATVAYGDERIHDVDAWHQRVGWAAGELFGTRIVIWRKADTDSLSFVGRADNVKMSLELAASIIAQIERLYKRHLPKNMTKADRAQYRREFKMAAATVVFHRAHRIMEDLRRAEAERAAAQAPAATGTALSLIDHHKQLHEEADAFLKGEDIKSRKVRDTAPKPTLGNIHGMKAGEEVQIQEKVR
jgi:hypothetical protein